MEKMGKKTRIRSKQQIQSFQEESYSGSKSKMPKINRKITKIHRKKKGKIFRAQIQAPPLVYGPIHKMATFLTTPKEEIFASLRNKLNKKVHVKNIIDKDVARCYPKIKQNHQDSINAYKELIAMGGLYPNIENIGLKSLQNDTHMSISYLKDYRALQATYQTHSRRILHSNEVALIQRRQQLISQIVTFVQGQQEEKGYPLQPVDEVLLEILALCKLNASIQLQIGEQLQRIMRRSDGLLGCHDLQEVKRRQFLLRQAHGEAMVIKNLQLSFDEAAIDYLNYHLSLQKFQENNLIENQFQKISSVRQFILYAENRKPKHRKSTKYYLKTPCSACFSHYFERSNPILNCPECHIRVHQFCQNIQNRCHRCRYSRTSNKEKQLSSYCYICHRENEKGTMIQTVTNQYPHQYAHNYCLLLHKFWTIQAGAVHGQYVPAPEENQRCCFCGKNQGHFFVSLCCGISMHGMCAYLQGCSLRMRRGIQNGYRIEIDCCGEQEVKRRLSFERKFKLNWEKIVLRKDKEVLGHIQKQIKKQSPIDQ